MRYLKFSFLCLALAGTLFSSCKKDDAEAVLPDPDHFVGAIGEPFTRTVFTAMDKSTLKGSWNQGDRVAVFSDGVKSPGVYSAAGYGATSDLDAVTALSAEKAPYVAWYPEPVASGSLPSVQTFGPDSPMEVPMMAKSPTRQLYFSPVCGLLEFKLSTSLEDVLVKSLYISADRPLSGVFTVNDKLEAVVSDGSGVTLDCGSGVPLGTDAKSFWVSVPPGEYSGVCITLNADGGRTQSYSLKGGNSVKVLRGRVTSCPIELKSVVDPSEGTAYLPCGQDFNIFMKVLANPDMPSNGFEPSVRDSSIVRLHFETGKADASGQRLGASEPPVYASFNPGTGIMTVSTPARSLHAAADCSGMFRYMAALEEVNVEALQTDGLIDMSHMFNHCHNLKSLDLSGISSTDLCDMDNCFSDCWALESIDFTGFETINVTTFRSCFNRCYSVKKLDLGSFRTENCRTMGYMFYRCRSLQELVLTSFDLREVATLSYCFYELSSLAVVCTGGNFFRSNGSRPDYFFGASTSADGARTGSVSKGISFYTDQASADWLAKTNLRWIPSGYKNMTPVPVKFFDKDTGAELTVTWASN